MKRLDDRIYVLPVLFLLVLACSTVPLTGRKQLNLIPTSTMLSTSFQQYDEFLKASTLSSHPAHTGMVKGVGRRIQHAVEQYFAERKMAHKLEHYDWTFNLVEHAEPNAWCMPGGKVVVYTGILPITRDEVGLAVVMGHEIAHAVANHVNERMSHGLVTDLGGMALSKALEEQP